MRLVEDQSVQLVVTSPPYWQLKDYGDKQQIGFHESYESYINNLNLVWQECHRVLSDGCRLCINIGDQFARSVYYGRYKVIPIRTEIIRFCETIGFDYMGAVIWQKKTTTNTTGGGSLMGSYPYPRNGVLAIDYEFILLFKKQGTPPKVNKEVKLQSAMTKEEWKAFFSGHWQFGGARQDGHIAMFPEELPRRLIKMFSFVGETVLDPFAGSATTSLAARNLGRHSVGYEINEEFIDVARKKLQPGPKEASTATCSFLKCETDTERKVAPESLPYLFVDPHKLEKKTDTSDNHYGSKINKESKQRENYYTVKEVISPVLLKLSTGKIIRLLGVSEKDETFNEAVSFLKRKTKGQKVYFRMDNDHHEDHNHLPVYLYLKNRTFINAHLIKKGLALPDTENNYKHRQKFIDLL